MPDKRLHNRRPAERPGRAQTTTERAERKKALVFPLCRNDGWIMRNGRANEKLAGSRRLGSGASGPHQFRQTQKRTRTGIFGRSWRSHAGDAARAVGFGAIRAATASSSSESLDPRFSSRTTRSVGEEDGAFWQAQEHPVKPAAGEQCPFSLLARGLLQHEPCERAAVGSQPQRSSWEPDGHEQPSQCKPASPWTGSVASASSARKAAKEADAL
jgi:hypothetical protein